MTDTLSNGQSIGTISCTRCNMDYDLGPTEEGAIEVMDRFFTEHHHE